MQQNLIDLIQICKSFSLISIFNCYIQQKTHKVHSMCIIPRIGKSNSIYDLPMKQKVNLAKKLPQLTQKRMLAVAKNILFKFLDNLADYIFTNGKIYTMSKEQAEVQAVAIRGGQIIFTGLMADALVYKGANTKIVDLKGRTMLPGFIDPHIHMCFTMFRHWLDMSPFVNADMEQIKQKLIVKVEQVKGKPNQWITGQLFDPTVTHGEFDVSRENLDKICPDNPIFILQANGHIAHVNSAALKIAGITKQTPDPPLGRFIKNKQGQLTGQLQETAVMLIKEFLIISGQDYVTNFRHFLQHCASKGCTSLHDCGIGLLDPKSDLAVLLQVMENQPPVRYSGMLVSTCWDTWMEQKMVPQFKDQILRINGVKCWSDGSAQGGSAYLRQQYLKPEWGKGSANYSLQCLVKSIKVAHDQGWQVGVHANGDASIDMVLDAFQIVQKQNPRSDLRHRIQHCTICHKQQLKRMKQLHVSPSFLIGHIYYYGYAFQKNILGEQRANLLDPMKSAIQYGLRPTLHSDYNCQPVDPIRCIYNAVTRKTKHGDIVLNPSQCVTPYQAIKGITIDSAWQCHMDDIVGSIQKGKKADFVILNENPMMIPESQIINIKVVQTWMDGVRRFKSQQLKTLQSFNSQNAAYNSQTSIKSKQSKQSV